MINLLMALWTAAAQTTIVVEDHANIEVYVNTPKILNYSSETEGHISSKSVYTNNAKYWKSGKVINERGTYDKLGTRSNVKIYDKETVVQMMLFNPDMTLLSTSTVSDRGEVNYIKQQETRITMTRGRIDMRVMPEQKPLKWIIPAHLLEGYVRQAAHGLWLGVKIQ